MTEKEKYENKIRIKVQNGLKEIRFIFTDKPATKEEMYAELNRMQNSPDMEDKEVLGKYSPKL